MAKQIGIYKVKGTLDQTTFSKSKDGFLVKMKSNLSGARVKSDAAFKRTQENFSEFGKAAKAGKTLRHAIPSLLGAFKDSRMNNQLTRKFLKVLQADAKSARGLRTVTTGDISLLKDFNFNATAPLNTIFMAPFTTVVQRPAGTLTVNIPSFIPNNVIRYPQGATHYKIVTSGVEANFNGDQVTTDIQESAILPIDQNATAVMNLVNTISANSTNQLLLIMGIQFYKQTNGSPYLLNSKAFNALTIVDAQ